MINKKRVVLIGPITNVSGYSEHARTILESLLEMQNQIDLYVLPTQWAAASTDEGYTQKYTPIVNKTTHLIQTIQQQAQQQVSYQQLFDISIQVRPPNEFENLCDINIGVTAALETTFAPEGWIPKCNAMKEILVPSEHCKKNLQNTRGPGGTKIVTPIRVIPHSCSWALPKGNIYDKINITTSFNFLSMFQFAPRKNYENMIKWFIEEFKDDPEVGLVIKTHLQNNSMLDFYNIRQRLRLFINSIAKDKKCKIYFTHGNLKENDIMGYYDKNVIDCYINIAHGEGFGIPILYASCNDIPVIATAWSGQLDFLRMPTQSRTGKKKIESKFLKVAYDIAPVQQQHLMPNLITPECEWAYPKEESYKKNLRNIRKNKDQYVEDAKTLGEYNRQNYNPVVVAEKYKNFMNNLLQSLAFSDNNINEIMEY